MVPLPTTVQGQRSDDGVASPGTIPADSAVVPVAYWRIPWDADPLHNAIDKLTERPVLPPLPAAVVGPLVAEVQANELNLDYSKTKLSFTSVASCHMEAAQAVGYERR